MAQEVGGRDQDGGGHACSARLEVEEAGWPSWAKKT
jgi:hypothetical protein